MATQTAFPGDVILALGDAQRVVPVLLKQVGFQDEVTTTFRLKLESSRVDLLFEALDAVDVRLQLAVLVAENIHEADRLDPEMLGRLRTDFGHTGWEIASVELGSLDLRLRAMGARFRPLLSKAWTALTVLSVFATLTGVSAKDVIPELRKIDLSTVVSASQSQYEAAGRFVDGLVGQIPRSVTIEIEITDARGDRLVCRIVAPS